MLLPLATADESSVEEIDVTPSRSVALYVSVGFVPRSYEPDAMLDETAGGVRSSWTLFVTTVLLPALSVTRTATEYVPSAVGSATLAVDAYATGVLYAPPFTENDICA